MTLRLYNTLTRTKEDFRPLDPTNVRMYVCGPTVYDYAHIGNARPVIVFDVLFRLLRHLYGEEHVTYVRNITDVDDKINARAREEGISIRELTERHPPVPRRYRGARRASSRPTSRAPPRQIPEMIAHHREADRGAAMPMSPRATYSSKWAPMRGLRQARPPLARRDDRRRPRRSRALQEATRWTSCCGSPPMPDAGLGSPWGRGRPGWHIECSAMSWKLLGETFDIHGGGIDLVFPHHENEIAQTPLRLRPRRHGERLDAQRLPPGRRPEDVEEPRQLRDHQRDLARMAGRAMEWISNTLQDVGDSLPPADGLERQTALPFQRRLFSWREKRALGNFAIKRPMSTRGLTSRIHQKE